MPEISKSQNPDVSKAKNLVLVPCHAVYVGVCHTNSKLSAFWRGDHTNDGIYYTQHMRAGLAAAENSHSILVFSGGQTKREVGPVSEALSYYNLAEQYGWHTNPDSPEAKRNNHIKERATTEEFARDSFENLAFGICRFVQLTSRMPEEIIVKGWKFKEERYKFHADTLNIKQGAFHYEGVNDPIGIEFEEAKNGEAETLANFEKCPLGNEGALQAKRVLRDPFRRGENAYAYYRAYQIFKNILRRNHDPMVMHKIEQ